jgi:LmbE family N-acetylglucosaminyl deacetylase
MEITEDWQGIKEILVILAHPDDPEFFLGGTVARWVSEGHTVRYVLLTKGEKGAVDESISPGELSTVRVREQNDAAQILGVASVAFLDYFDGEIFPDLEMRGQIVRAIRKYRPNILVTCDPDLLFPRLDSINHPDHRYTGQVVLDAVFPAAGNPRFFPELIGEGFFPHEVDEVWLSLTGRPNVLVDVTRYWQKKIAALRCHKSQIVDLDRFEQERIEKLYLAPSQPFKVEEKFHRIKFRRIHQ